MTNQYDKAIEDFNYALSLDSNHVAANTEIGFSFAKLEKYDVAIKYLDKSLMLDTLRHWAYYYRGVCNFHLHKYIPALSDFNKTIELGQKDAYIYNARSKTYLMLNRFYESLTDVNNAIELDSGDTELIWDKNYLTKEINSLEKLKSKIREYSFKINSGESDPELYYQRGTTYLGMLDYIPEPKDETWNNIENDLIKYIELAPTGKNSKFANNILSAKRFKKNK